MVIFFCLFQCELSLEQKQPFQLQMAIILFTTSILKGGRDHLRGLKFLCLDNSCEYTSLFAKCGSYERKVLLGLGINVCLVFLKGILIITNKQRWSSGWLIKVALHEVNVKNTGTEAGTTVQWAGSMSCM